MQNFIFALSNDGAKYKQIYQQIKGIIEKGILKADEQLPSIRTLAQTLKVSRNTTLMAYEQLVAEGYIRGEGRRGYFVNELEPIFLKETDFYKENKLMVSDKILIDFRAGAVDQKHFPFQNWRQCSNQALLLKKSYVYGEHFGEAPFKEQLVQYLLQSRGIQTQPDNIIIGSSTQQLLIFVSFLLKQKFSSIILEDPGYSGAYEAFKLQDFNIETLPVTTAGADLEVLKTRRSQLLYVTPSHHFPLGVSLTIQQRQTVIKWAKQVNGYVIEDDYDSEFRYEQQPFPALASLDHSNVIYLGTFSKSFLPGIRLAYMVLPASLITSYKNMFSSFEHNASSIHQLSMGLFMEQGEWTRHIKRMRMIYKQKMHLLVSTLKEVFSNKVSIVGHQSGLYVLIKVHTEKTEKWLIESAEKNGVRIYPTSPYFIQQTSEEPLLQLGFSSLEPSEIINGIKILKNTWF